MKKKKTEKQNPSSVIAQIKVSRKLSREEEIKLHGKPIGYFNVVISKKIYNRKKNKADASKAQPYLFLFS